MTTQNWETIHKTGKPSTKLGDHPQNWETIHKTGRQSSQNRSTLPFNVFALEVLGQHALNPLLIDNTFYGLYGFSLLK